MEVFGVFLFWGAFLKFTGSALAIQDDERCQGSGEISKGINPVQPYGQQYPGPPEFLIPLRNTTVCQGHTAEIKSVFVTGNSPTNVSWYKDGTDGKNFLLIEIDGKKFHTLLTEDDYHIFLICDTNVNDSGWYTIHLENRFGPVNRRAWVNVDDCSVTTQPNVSISQAEDVVFSPPLYIYIPIGILVLLFVIIIVVVCRRRIRNVCRKQWMTTRRTEIVDENPLYNLIPQQDIEDICNLLDPEQLINQENLRLEYLLGVGAFGKVYKGLTNGLDQPPVIAIKMLKDDATYSENLDFVKEIEMMKTIGRHMNIIGFYGYSIDVNSCIQMVVEYAEHGNLREFLRQQDPTAINSEIVSRGSSCHSNVNVDNDDDFGSSKTTTHETQAASATKHLVQRDLISFAFQVARGMEYLSSIKILHRDLAARNVLVADDYVLKIADFGLTRNMTARNYYQRTSSGLLPVMWMAPESLEDNRYTTKSDVWSFGVLLWEIFSFGIDPYPNVSPEDLLEKLLEGYRMEKPATCIDSIADVMYKCWDLNPVRRPDFVQLVRSFDRIVTNSVSSEYLNLENVFDDQDMDSDEVFKSELLCQQTPDDSQHIHLPLIAVMATTEQPCSASSVDSQYASLSSSQPNSSLSDSCHEDGSQNQLPLYLSDSLSVI